MKYDKGRGASFEISKDGDKYEGGSYDVRDNGDVVNAAIGNAFPNAVYAKIGDKDINKIIKKIKMYESVNEANDTFFRTASDAVDYARKMIEKRGFEIDEDDWQSQIAMGGRYSRLRPSKEKTHSFSIGLLKNGKPQRKMLQISLYGMPSGKYELTYYVN